MSTVLNIGDRFSQAKLAEIAHERLPRHPETRRVLKLVSPHLEKTSLMAAVILAREFESKPDKNEGDTLVAAALLAGAHNFDDVSGQIDGAASAIAHEFRDLTGGGLPLHQVNKLSLSARRLFFAGMVADLETSASNTQQQEENTGLGTLAELIRIAAQSGDVDKALLRRTAAAFNHLSAKAGHKSYFILTEKGQLVVEVKVPPREKWSKDDRLALNMRAPRPPQFKS